MKNSAMKKVISMLLTALLAFSGIMPTITALADDGVEGIYDLQIFYDESNTMVPTYGDDGESEYIEYMFEGDTLQLKHQLIDSVWPDNGYVKWYSSCPTIVDVDNTGKVKAFDSSKGAVIHLWIDTEVKSIPIIGKYLGQLFEKALFNEYVDLDSMDTEEIVDLIVNTMGSDSLLADYIEAYQGQLVDSLREYLDMVNTSIVCELYDGNDTLVDEDYIKVAVKKCEEWYANFLPNGTHITNKASINTTQAKGASVQIYAITTPQRLGYGTVYSVKSSSIFSSGKVVATVNDSGLVSFKNVGSATILVSPDSEDVVEGILKMINYFYTLENTGTLDTDKIAQILIDYMGIDMNRTALAALLDAAFAIYEIAGDTADPVQLTATAVEIIANIVLQMAYNDSITFDVVEAKPLTDFDIEASTTSVKEGTQIGLGITNISPEAGDITDITWSSSDPTIARVDPTTGVVTGLDAGGSLGSLSSQTVEIIATSAANNVSKTVTITVTGKTGKYLSAVDINGEDIVDIDCETDYTYTVFPQRVADANNLYISWGMLTGEDEEGNPIYTWATDEEPVVSDGIGQIDKNGHYKALDGGKSTIALSTKTGYFLSNGSFYEISNILSTKEVKTGIPVEKITIQCVDGTSNGDKNRDNIITINGIDYDYVTIHKGVMEGYAGNGGKFTATVEPANATNQNLTWVVDNQYYEKTDLSSDTHSISIKQKAGHEVADTFNVYAVSNDGKVASNVVTVCVTRNYVTGNTINQDVIEVVRGYEADVTHSLSFDGSWTGTAYACYKANWYSGDESIFSVRTNTNDNRDGIITGNDVGVSTVYCVSADGGIIDTATVIVKPDKQYLREIVNLCDNANIVETKENKSLYKQYMRKLDLAYTVLYDEDMASQATCDTYAQNLLSYFYKLGGFVGINSVTVLGTNKTILNKDYVTVNVGSTTSYTKYSYDFDYAVNPKTAMYSTAVWESSNTSISVDSNGRCTPTINDPCSATITCTIVDYMGNVAKDSAVVAFARTAATGITLNESNIVGGKVGETFTLVPTVTPTNVLGNSTASCKDVSWQSSNDKVASVDSNGVVTFNYGGDCVITCTTMDGGYSAICYVNVVTNYDPLQLLINQYNDLQLNEINFYPETWIVYSDAMQKAQTMIDQGGYSQVEVDDMCIELEEAYKGLRKFVYIQNVELYLDGEQTSEFYQYDLSLLREGISYTNASLDLNVRLYPNNASYESARWESSTSDISVTTSGVCSPTSNKCCYGLITCTVTDAFGNEYADSVWVSFSYYPVTAVKLSDEYITGAVGETYQLAATIEPTGTSLIHAGKASIQDYYWESADERVATVDSTGLVKFVGAGSTVIRAVSYDGGVTGECTVSTEGDRSKLKEALDKYKDVNYQEYEYSYGQAFLKAYKAANDALTDLSLDQESIDTATNNLVNAGEALASHPYIKVESIAVSWKTVKENLVGTKTDVASGTVGSGDAVSINLSSGYSNYNNYNYIELNAGAYPANAMYKSISMEVVETNVMDVKNSNATYAKLAPNKTNSGGWARVVCTAIDHYDRVTTREIYVVMSDNTCTGISVTPTEITTYANAGSQTITSTISGNPEFSTVIWSSSDEKVATVSNGVVTPVDKGVAYITARTMDGGYIAQTTITVNVDYSTLAEKVEEYTRFINNQTGKHNYTEESLDILRTNLAVAKDIVDNNTALQAEVDAALEALNKSYDELVLYITATGVALSVETNSNVTEPNSGYARYTGTTINSKTIQLAAEILPANYASYLSMEWSSSNDSVSVDSFGCVTNNSPSAKYSVITCTITNDNGVQYSSSYVVSFVRYGVTAVTFDDEMIYGAPQQTKKLNVNLNQSSTTIKTSHVDDCKYSSSNDAVASVDENGNVTFKMQGTATITVTAMDGGYVGKIVAYTTWDTTALQAAIAEAEAIDYQDYSYNAGMALKSALEDAKVVYANIYATQAEIDEACANLTTAISNLEGNEFITPEATITANGIALGNNLSYSVDAANRLIITAALNEGAMVKSAVWTYEDASGATATASANKLTVTKTTSGTGIITVIYTVTDDYDRVTEYRYTINLVDQIINITSINLTIDGVETTETTYSKTGHSYNYTDYTPIQLGYVAYPANASPANSVTWKSSASSYVTVSEDGVINLTTAGKIRQSNTATITCTVTNADGTTLEKSINITIAR